MLDKVLEEIESVLDCNFNDKQLLKTAITHKSWAVEHKTEIHNERLEFLGDSVLSTIISEYLYKNFPQKTEGELSKLKASLVSKTQLSKWAKELNLGKYILLSSSEELSGGRKKDTILAGVFEAILGAIYLDQGIEKCKSFILEKFLSKGIKVELKDYKSILQEIIQKELKLLPIYEIIKETGPDHAKEFDCIVKVGNNILGYGKGKTKKQAQQDAAKKALENINKIIK